MSNLLPSNFEKHRSTNPFQRWLIGRFNTQLIAAVRSCGSIRTILDVGCGEGFTLHVLEQAGIKAKLSGVDYVQAALDLGHRQFPTLDLRKGDIYALKHASASTDLVICTEVLEHLDDPEKALSELVRVSRSYVLVSVPHEPWFMFANFLRGKYVSRFGNHPEHINHWSRDRFIALLRSSGLEIIAVHTPFPWTMVLARVSTV